MVMMPTLPSRPKVTDSLIGIIFTGIARWVDGHLFLDREDNKFFQLPDNALERIKPVPPSVADILQEAEFYVPIYIAPIPNDENPKDYIQTGLKWPE